MNRVKMGLFALAALAGASGGALAMPAAPLGAANAEIAARIEEARFNCRPYGCHRGRHYAARPYFRHRHHRWRRW